MGKNTDKLYVTHSEHAAGPGGAKRRTGSEFKRLPFYCCSLSLQPFEHPVCTKDGMVFDLMNIIPFLKKFNNKNPVNGETLMPKDLLKLHFHKNGDGEYYCPITFKVFNENTHIVAVATSGNVYSYEAIERLNIQTKHWADLLTDEPFKRKDIITIQDPHEISKRNISEFFYIKNDMKVEDEEAKKLEKEIGFKINAMGATDRVLKAMRKKDSEAAGTLTSSATSSATESVTPSFVSKEKKAYNAAHYSTGVAAASFTSTAVPVETKNAAAIIDEEEYMFQRIKEKGYAQVRTNLGNVNLELYCGDTPRTAYNFIQLAKKGYYKNTSFHRSVKNFMIQGGDPTGTGRGGESFWGKPFNDEFKANLTHTGRGVLSMANKGKNTNTSQFFITYRSCQHLDYKHTVFGKVVGGMDVLTKMESIETDDGDKPKQDIRIIDIEVFVDPFETFRESLAKQLETGESGPTKKGKQKKKEDEKNSGGGGGVGKYLKRDVNAGTIDWGTHVGEVKKKQKVTSGGFGDFSSW
ncbi:uncharacterized protein SPPG_00017 [Spizellomyces punctatus DAOM BR117]|uniref:RING-type E3 ubiquitin transferase n=2 Tax=Spizellomyces punctatus (strain DAOM BR117) TaxID=645134 RepID=A0A0L0HTQ1_SPIPD|nr:uncharacterized protein SPPG_00017 [Spizellomyces punctatus DAOM BR117]KND04280.1 hypothetical protein SPPG_00017 [Spizellomyces punctatus DAOM BR117]|eukprot:XP_016612319.1 hypothetical protein SPPG_00017 [Spizellomyces punctatus DAOM BR117]